MDLKIEILCNVCLLGVWVSLSPWVSCVNATVTYDHTSLIINGQRKILISGSIHYPRSTPEMWPDLIQKAKEGGLDVIQTYVFWNGHESLQGQYHFEDRFDLVKFIKLVQEAGLYLHLRIGPYVCAEWNFGGFPVWLKYVPSISFRTDNEPFKYHMQKFIKKIVDMMKAENLFQSQGGPIILCQIENEYGPVEKVIGDSGTLYVKWAANLTVGLDTGVPWVMCKQDDAPDPIIDTCNSVYCDSFKPHNVSKPTMWTENWTGWFTSYGRALQSRPVEDLAFSVARFIQNGGSFINYYMYHGGTNFGRTAGGPFIATSYDYDAPLDEYGLVRNPKWGHLRKLHEAIKLCEKALVSVVPIATSLGLYQEARVFKSNSSGCSAFLANYDQHSNATVYFNNNNYSLPPSSLSILPDCNQSLYNTAKVDVPTVEMKMTAIIQNLKWISYAENLRDDRGSFRKEGLVDQLDLTWDSTDYLLGKTMWTIEPNEKFLRDGELPTLLTVLSAGHVLHVFINGTLSETVHGSVDHPKVTFNKTVKLRVGANEISFLSTSVGLSNIGLHFENWPLGVFDVSITGLNEGKRNLTNQKWTYKIGLVGESLSLYTENGSSSVHWSEGDDKAFTWHMTTFFTPPGQEPLALDMTSMGKGLMWINGNALGRYWPLFNASGYCATRLPYAVYKGCGEPTQKWYHVPRPWLKADSPNLLVVFEELGGDPNQIAVVKREM